MKPAISVVIPTLNEGKFIEYTLASARNQDFEKKYEIIVSDSSSKDNTARIARKHADRVIVTKKMGVSAGRNAGAAAAKGDLLLFLDADTVLLPNVLSEVYDYFQKHRRVIGLNVPLLCDSYQKNILYLASTYVYRALKRAKLQPIYAVCFACKRNAFFEAGGFPENLKVAEDIHLGQRLKKLGRIDYLKSTFAITSSRRLQKWNLLKQLNAWPLGYLYIKYLKLQPAYPPIRSAKK
ncbi:MAG TPA: glycosyltransferase [archaeon]|nr:glycosyltransferase [archaeon]